MPECCQKNCDADAVAKVYWPGEGRKVMCAIHVMKAQQIGAAMGAVVTSEMMTPEEMLADEGAANDD